MKMADFGRLFLWNILVYYLDNLDSWVHHLPYSIAKYIFKMKIWETFKQLDLPIFITSYNDDNFHLKHPWLIS